MKTVYLVMAHHDHEHSDPIRGFARKPAAEAFSRSCYDYDTKRPDPPSAIENTPENDAEHEAWWKKMQRWSKRHPAGADNINADSYPVVPLKVEGLSP